MKVKIDPFQVSSYLEKKLGEDYVFSLRPDHPQLYSSPDLLVGGHGRLFAIFNPSVKDIKFPWLVRINNPVAILDHVKREIIAVRFYEIPADAIISASKEES